MGHPSRCHREHHVHDPIRSESMRPRYGSRSRNTGEKLYARDGPCNQIDMPQATAEVRNFCTWFQFPVEGREIVLTFNMNSVIGDKGAPGLAYVALVGYTVESEDGGTGKKEKKNHR